MKYGVFLPNFGILGQARVLADLAADAERAGWDGFFIWDHIARKPEFGEVVDTWVALTAIAMRTTRIHIGALVTPLPRRRPWKVARETASIHQLSGGRLIFGAGIGSTGGSQLEWENFGEATDLKQRGAMLDEGLDILTGLWRSEPFSYEGQFYHVKDAQFLPAARIPVWIAGTWANKAPFRRAAKWDGVVPTFNGDNPVGQLKEMMAYLDEIRNDDRPFEIVVQGVTPDAAQAAEIIAPYREAGATWWLEDLRPSYFGDTWTIEAVRARVLRGIPF
jgi:alkanesulfonate monooxygenase SsuD/methylene tetrahydromethanopterin reductase-like flavin-dependent oxidoreductase (luciferase family)